MMVDLNSVGWKGLNPHGEYLHLPLMSSQEYGTPACWSTNVLYAVQSQISATEHYLFQVAGKLCLEMSRIDTIEDAAESRSLMSQ